MEKELDDGPELYINRLLSEAKGRSCVLGREVLVTGHEGLAEARAVDINEQGFLIVEDPQGRIHTLSSGEISLSVK